MVNYNCQRCGYTTNIKTIMLRHYNRKKVCNPVLDDIDITPGVPSLRLCNDCVKAEREQGVVLMPFLLLQQVLAQHSI